MVYLVLLRAGSSSKNKRNTSIAYCVVAGDINQTMSVTVRTYTGPEPCSMKAKPRQDLVENTHMVFCCPRHSQLIENGVAPTVRHALYCTASTLLYGIHRTVRHSPCCEAFAAPCGIHLVVQHSPRRTDYTVLYGIHRTGIRHTVTAPTALYVMRRTVGDFIFLPTALD